MQPRIWFWVQFFLPFWFWNRVWKSDLSWIQFVLIRTGGSKFQPTTKPGTPPISSYRPLNPETEIFVVALESFCYVMFCVVLCCVGGFVLFCFVCTDLCLLVATKLVNFFCCGKWGWMNECCCEWGRDGGTEGRREDPFLWSNYSGFVGEWMCEWFSICSDLTPLTSCFCFCFPSKKCLLFPVRSNILD
jgi:hypothetical protein